VALKQLIAEQVPGSPYKLAIMRRIEQNLDPANARIGGDEMATIWERKSPTPEAYAKSLAGLWCDPGYPAEAAPYVRHALVARVARLRYPGVNSPDNPDAKALASAFLDEAHCPGAHALSEADQAILKEIAAQAAPPAPKP
jgi:hypothetical protein